MLNAVLVGNRQSGMGRQIDAVQIPGRWIDDPAALTPDDYAEADLLAIFGGDGTIQKTVTRMLRDAQAVPLPPIAVLPFGTTNMTAADLNHARSRKLAIARLDDVVRNSNLSTHSRPMVRVTADGLSHYGFFFGLGVIASVIEDWNQQRKPDPLANQLRSFWALVTGLRRTLSATEIRMNEESLSVYGLLATTLERLLFGSHPYWGQNTPCDLKFTWVEGGTPNLLRHAPALLRGSPKLARVPGFASQVAGSAQLDLAGPYILDGEIFQSEGHSLLIDRSAPIRWVAL